MLLKTKPFAILAAMAFVCLASSGFAQTVTFSHGSDIYATITSQHNDQRNILVQLKDTDNTEVNTRTSLLNQYLMQFLSHARAEELIIYPPLRSNSNTKNDALDALQEHHDAYTLIWEMLNIAKGTDAWKAKAAFLYEAEMSHMRDEETTIFGDINQYLSSAQVAGFNGQFASQEQSIANAMQGSNFEPVLFSAMCDPTSTSIQASPPNPPGTGLTFTEWGLCPEVGVGIGGSTTGGTTASTTASTTSSSTGR